MLPKWHALLGFVFALLLIYFFDFSLPAAIIIFLSSVLIDVDHYFYYVWKKRDLSLTRAYRWFIEESRKMKKINKNKRKQLHIIIFHGIEFWIFILILSFLNKLFFYILLGISFHFLLDFVHNIYSNIPLNTKFSQIYIWQTNKNKKLLS